MADAEEEVRAIAKELARKRATQGSQTVSVGAIRDKAKQAGCRALMHKSHEDVKAWLAARPEDYVLLGGDEVLVVAAVREGTEPSVPPGTRKRINKAAKRCLRCETCNIHTDNVPAMQAHILSQRHHNAVSRLKLADVQRVLTAYRTRNTADLQFCELCSEWLPGPNELKLHLRSRYHAVRQCALLLRGGDLLGANAGGVVVSVLPDPLPALEPGQTADYAFRISNLSGVKQSLLRVRLLQSVDGVELSDAYGVSSGDGGGAGVGLPHGSSYEVAVRLAPRFRGVMRGVAVFEFGSGAQAVRAIHAVCADADTQAEMDAKAAAGGGSAQRRGRRLRRLEPQNPDIVPGEAPAGADDHGARSGGAGGGSGRPPRLERPIGHHPVPRDVRGMVERCQWAELERRLCEAAGGEEAVAEAAAAAAAAAAGGGCVEAAARAAALAARMPNVRAYAERLKLLTWLEELQHEVDVRTYDMREARLEEIPRRSLLALKVPGLAENRPSVLKGDSIYVRPSDGSSGGREWEGIVHVVEKEEVLLGFAASFRHGTWVKGRAFDVRFAVNRSLFNKLQAVLSRTAAGELNPLLLLPGGAAAPRLPPPPRDLPIDGPDVDWLHPPPLEEERRRGSVAGAGGLLPAAPVRAKWGNRPLNAEQRLAVREVVRGAHAPLPYIIYGPPGTGKTSTLVEAAVQLLHAAPSAVLLAVAPSNSAADQLMQRLLGAGRPKSEMMRVCAYTRPDKDLPPDLDALRGTPQINWSDGAGAFLLPSKEQLTRPGLRVVVCTCATATMLYHVGVPSGHFTHLLLDEAGHAEEPLLLAGLAGLAGPGCRVVMAGDPQQLGPVILSPLAKRHGLDTSLLERLTATAPYSRRDAAMTGSASPRLPPYASAYLTKLLHNYRSHPALLELPSAAFYHGELVAAADPGVTHSLLHWEHLPNKRVPLLFHNLVGRDEQEQSSPSWYNLDEAKQVVAYVKSLKDMRRSRLNGDDIGVISPYRKQVQRIRALLRAVDDHIKVGSVEEFQGQERRVIIISTVRSSREHMALDARHRLGFLCNPKRFNVALTRAKALLVVVGCADVLATDAHWAAFLRLARDHGAVTGQALPELPPAPVSAAAAAAAAGAAAKADEDEDGGGVVGQLAASLQQLLLSAAAHGDGAGGAVGGRGLLSDLEEQLRWLGGGLEMEGGEMRRME